VALRLLGLEPGASIAAIKRAYRRLAKAHHPDVGGDVAAFHRLDAAYRLLIDSERQV
jgi:curved DNA-binding protein CbpA